MTWTAVNIRSLCERTGTTDPRRRPDLAFRYIDISGIDRDLKRIGTAAEVMGADAPSRARQVVKARDVLVSTVRPNLNAVAMVPDDMDGEVASTGFCILRAIEQVLDPRFLFYFTRTDRFVNALLQHVRGANYPAVTDRNVHDVEIPWPAKSEQQRIVEILDQADALRQQRHSADEKAQGILSSLFHKLFGDPATNPKGWPTERFGSVVDIGTTLVDPNQPEYLNLPHIGGEHIEKDTGRLLSPPLVRESDLRSSKFYFGAEHVLYSKIRPYLNKVTFPRCAGVCSADIYPLRPKDGRIGPWFLVALLRSQAFLAYATVHYGRLRMPKLNREQLGAFEMPLPAPELIEAFERQAQQIADFHKSRHAIGERVERLFDVLLHRAFTGDLTAKWREARKDQLETEMQTHIAALEQAKTATPKRGRKGRNAGDSSPTADGQHTGHDMFNKAALVTYIVTKCHDPQRPHSLGRTKLAKLFYLVQRRAEISLTQQFARRVAGPLDDAIHKFLNLAKKNDWLALPKADGPLKPVVPGDNPQPAIEHVRHRWANALEVMDEVLETMKSWGWEALERWATVENASQQLATESKSITLAAIKGVIAAEPKWRPKLDRPAFSDFNIQSTIKGLRDHGYLPAEAGANH